MSFRARRVASCLLLSAVLVWSCGESPELPLDPYEGLHQLGFESAQLGGTFLLLDGGRTVTQVGCARRNSEDDEDAWDAGDYLYRWGYVTNSSSGGTGARASFGIAGEVLVGFECGDGRRNSDLSWSSMSFRVVDIHAQRTDSPGTTEDGGIRVTYHFEGIAPESIDHASWKRGFAGTTKESESLIKEEPVALEVVFSQR